MYVNKHFDAFFSHNSLDKTLVEKLACRLEDEEGLRIWLDKWNLIPGDPWQEALERALDDSRTCAVFIGPSGISPWENEEMRSSLQKRVRETKFRVIPVLLPGATLPERGELPLFLSRLSWVDFRGPDGLENANAFRRLVAGIRGVAPGRHDNSLSTKTSTECPYRGLEVFDEKHAKYFFGRDATTQHLVETIRSKRFLAIIGPSGSGKSSVARAGLLTQLKNGAIHFSESWRYVTFKPGANPLHELAVSLAHTSGHREPLTIARQLLSNLEADERSLHLYARLIFSGWPKESRLFILVDQFEETLTQRKDEQELAQFFNVIRYATTISDGQTIVVITMRADFMGRAALHPEIAELLSGHQFIVSPMDLADQRLAIEEPARLASLNFEEGLVDLILRDVGGEPGALPLLEHLLLQLYEKRDRGGSLITLQAYSGIGGVQGALAKWADEIFNSFTPSQQNIARRVLLRLIQPGEGTEDTRRRAPMSEILAHPGEQPHLERVIEKLVNARLLTVSTDAKGDDQVDLVHEALIRGWPKLKAWIEEGRAAIRIHRRLSEATREWEDKNKDPSFLYRGVRLGQAVEWQAKHNAELNELEHRFLEASIELQQTERRALKRRLGLIIGGLIVALVFISTLAYRWFLEQKIASSREVASASLAQAAFDPELSLLLAVEAVHRARTSQAEHALRQALLLPPLPVIMRGHEGEVNSAVFSPDGKLILTASNDNTARVWDVQGGKPLRELRGHTDWVSTAEFSPDGKLIITGSRDATARIWRVADGVSLAELRGHKDWVQNAKFSPNGEYAVTTCEDGTARVWSVNTGKLQEELSGHADKVGTVAFSPDSAFVVTGSFDKTARIWNIKSAENFIPLIGHNHWVNDATFSPDGKYVATTSLDGTARVWDSKTGQSLYILRSQTYALLGVEFSPDGNFMVTISDDNTARVWDVKTRQLSNELRGHTSRISATFSPDGNFIVTASADNTARVWHARTGQSLVELRGHTSPLNRAVFSPDGNSVLTSSSDGTARLWNVLRMPGRVELRDPVSGVINEAAFSPDSRHIVTSSQDNTIRIWNAKTGELLRIVHGGTDSLRRVSFSSDGALILSAGDNTARIWDAATGQLLLVLLGNTGAVLSAAFSPDSKSVVTTDTDLTTRIWDAKTGLQLNDIHEPDSANSVAFSPDGKVIVSAGGDGVARVWSAASGKSLLELHANTNWLNDAAFSPDGKSIVTACGDNTARTWDAKTGQALSVMRGHSGQVYSAAFSPDGRFIITASDDRTVRVWDAKSGGNIAEFRGHMNAVNGAAFSPDSRSIVTASRDGTSQIYACDVCVSTDELLSLAEKRVTRNLTYEERRKFLHE